MPGLFQASVGRRRSITELRSYVAAGGLENVNGKEARARWREPSTYAEAAPWLCGQEPREKLAQ